VTRAVGFHNCSLAAKRAEPSFGFSHCSTFLSTKLFFNFLLYI
jgi:hypothetical protein